MNTRFFGQLNVSAWLSGVVLAGALLQGCMDQANGNVDDKADEEIVAIPVEVVTIANGDVAAFYSGTTTLESDEQATVVSQITGVVLELNAEEGDFVEAGQVLARVETDRYSLELERNNASLTQLETEFRRKQELFERKLVSAEDFERVSAEYQAQKASVGLAQLNLKYTRIVAPISGYVAERMIRVGNLVEIYQPVFNIASYDPLLAVLHVPERELSVLRKGQTVALTLDALPKSSFSGEVVRISPVVDPATGTFRVTAVIHDPDKVLKPGLFGRVDILYDMRKDVPLVPRSAVITEDEASHVFVVDDSNNVLRRPVKLGYERDGHVEIVDGLEAGEKVVTAGKGSLSEGSHVEIIEAPATKPGA